MGSIVSLCLLRILLGTSIVFQPGFIILLLNTVQIGSELFWYLMDAHVDVFEVLGAFILRRPDRTLASRDSGGPRRLRSKPIDC